MQKNILSLFWILILGTTFVSPVHSVNTVKKLSKRVEKHIDDLNKKYPMKKWAKQFSRQKNEIEELKEQFESAGEQGLQVVPYKKIIKLGRKIKKTREANKNLKGLIEELKTKSIVDASFPRVVRMSNRAEAGERARLIASLQKGEKRRLRKKEKLLNRSTMVINWYEQLQADWILLYSRKILFITINDQFTQFGFSANTKALNEFTRRLRLYSSSVERFPKEAIKGLEILETKIHIPKQSLGKLNAALSFEALKKTIMTSAAADEIVFSAEAEKKLKTILPILAQKNLLLVENRQEKWSELQAAIRQKIQHAHFAQQKIETKAERKRQMKLELSQMMDSDTPSIQLADSFEVALSTKTKPLSQSTVGSARNKLEVKVDSFSDTLAFIENLDLTLEKYNTDFKQINSDSKEATSLYTYEAEGGRADKNDLTRFVEEVGLISFGGVHEFLSYKLPKRWKPGKRIKWQAVKFNEQEESHDREFSYVELFREAHIDKPEEKEDYQYIQKIYIPANMLLVFGPGGKLIRFQTFGDIRNVRIRHSDLVNGALYYKFLNYSASGAYIDLNGIDHEIRVAQYP